MKKKVFTKEKSKIRQDKIKLRKEKKYVKTAKGKIH